MTVSNIPPNTANAVSSAPILPNTINGTPDILQAAGSRVQTIGQALAGPLTPLLPLIGTALVGGLTFLGLKAIVTGDNPLKKNPMV